jgi:hypothetical protein
MREPERIVRLKTVLARTGLPGPPSTVRSPRAPSRLRSKSAPTGPAGMNRTSTARSQIQSDGVRNASSMNYGDIRRCLLSARSFGGI